MKIRHTILSLALLIMANNASATFVDGTVSDLFIYPDYFVVKHGTSVYSASWSDFSEQHQSRILAMFLSAKTTGERFKAETIGTGPEGKPKFTGKFFNY